MEEPLLYVEPGFVGMSPIFLPDEEYGRALETFIVPCTDTLIIAPQEKCVYLAKRRVKPAQDWWWMIGGRRKAGISARDAMRETFKRETSLSIAPERLKYVAIIEYLFKDREQEPQGKNQHAQGITFSLELTPEERWTVAANLDPQEYCANLGLQSFTLEQLQDGSHSSIIVELSKRALAR